MKSLKDEAIEYAQQGWYVTAVKPRGKWRITGPHYVQPTKDADRIESWWRLFPDANIGLPTGSQYNALIVLDVDICGTQNGIDVIKNIHNTHGIYLPETSIVRSGSGGLHLYYKMRDSVPCKSGRNPLLGIDVRSESAHIVAPPSIHACGCRYEWLSGSLATIATATDDVYRLASLLIKNKGASYLDPHNHNV